MEIKEIKQQLSIEKVLAHYGVEADKNNKARCPFHDDKTPSLQIYPKTNSYCCFSSNCNAGAGDVIQFIQLKEKQGKHQAIQKAKNLLMNNGELTMNNSSQPIPKIAIADPIKEAEINTEILAKIFNYFRNGFMMRKDNKGRNYLQSRHLDISKLENLGIVFGYNSAQFHHRGRITPEEMQACEQSGLLIKSSNPSRTANSYTPWASHCVIFPLTNTQGKITGMYGRSVNTNPNSKTGKHYYLRNSKGLFYRPGREARYLIITESIIDFLTLYQIDEIRNYYDFLPLYGTNRLTEEHTEAIRQLKQLQEIIFFLDGDAAGRKATAKYAEQLTITNCILSIVNCPEGEDVNSLLDGHTPEIFTELLAQREVIAAPIINNQEQEAQPLFSNEVESLDTQEKSIEKGKNQLITKNPDYITYQKEDLQCVLLGGVNLKQLDRLRVTILIERVPKLSPLHSIRQSGLDLYNETFVDKFSRLAAERLETDTSKIRMILAEFIEQLDQYRVEQSKSKKVENLTSTTLSPEEKEKYIQFGKQPDLMQKINRLVGKAGVVGEEDTRVFLFTIAVSHLMPQPLNVVVQGSSGSGKSYLIKKISHLVPQTRVKRYTRLSEKSFYNFGQHELSNTLIIIEDYDGIGEEAEYALREIQSNGELISGISVKDEKTGEIKSKDRKVRGPIASMVATTKGEVYHDNSTRVFFIAVNESEAQTKKIIDYKNQKANGEILESEENKAKNKLQNFVSTLEPYQVKNPYLKHIKLPVPHDQLRRLHELFEAFCQQITLIHQHQRRIASDNYLITEKEDMQLAVELMFDSIVLKVDELDGSLRLFYEKLKKYIKSKSKKENKSPSDTDFMQREVRHALQMSKTGLFRNIQQLEELEYLQKKGTGSHGAVKYKIIYWDDNEKLRSRIKADLKKQIDQL